MEDILVKVLERIKPTPQEDMALKRAKEKVLEILEGLKKDFSFVEIVFVGSTARGTHLRGKSDIDVFILYPKGVKMDVIEEEIKKLGGILKAEMRYAQHPYIRFQVDGFDVEVVPAYKIAPGERIISATDRTPLHNEYLSERLSEKIKDDVRLLKAFMKGIGVYGAEIKVEGFSGYLCELLVVYYGGFLETLRAATRWRWGEYIDIEGHGRVREKAPLVVVDPIDPYRNVAHALSRDKMALFMVASREFLKRPSIKFFFPDRPRLTPKRIKETMDERKSRIVGVFTRYPEGESPDNVWSQLKRFGRLLERKVEERDNIVLQWEVWSDEKEYAVLLIEVVGRYTARIHRRMGPPVTDLENSEKFLEKHRNDPFGPWISDGRLVSFYYIDEKSLLIEILEAIEEIIEGESIGGRLLDSLREQTDVVENKGLLRYYRVEGFPEFLSHFLLRKFPWEY